MRSGYEGVASGQLFQLFHGLTCHYLPHRVFPPMTSEDD
jgi:hypothetical protein